MYNTMSIYKQKLHEIDEKIIENEKAENQVKKEMLDIARKGISLRKPKYIFHFFVSLALLGLAFISLPVLIGSRWHWLRTMPSTLSMKKGITVKSKKYMKKWDQFLIGMYWYF